MPVIGTVVDEAAFELLVRLEVEKAGRLQYPVSVVCLAPDLPAADVDPVLTRQIAERAIGHLRGTDVAALLHRSAIGLLLIDADARMVRQVLERVTRGFHAPASRAGAAGRVSLSAGATCYPGTAPSRRDLVSEARALMERAQAAGGDRLYFPS